MPKRKQGLPWWGWLGIAGGGVLLLSRNAAAATIGGVTPDPSRSPGQLLGVVAAIDPENNPALQAGGGLTHCNGFVELATAQLGVGLDNMSANDHYDWFQSNTSGWSQVSEDVAGQLANAGAPVVAIWSNPGGHGHMGLIIPGTPDQYDGLPMAQAGAHNFNGPDGTPYKGYVKNGFGNYGPVEYWAHA